MRGANPAHLVAEHGEEELPGAGASLFVNWMREQLDPASNISTKLLVLVTVEPWGQQTSLAESAAVTLWALIF